MQRYAITYLDRLGCLGVREIWERCDGDAVAKMEFLRDKDRWIWCMASEIPV